MLDLFTCRMGTLLVLVKTMKVDVKTSFDRRWDSNTREREFKQELVATRAVDEHLIRFKSNR